MFFAAVTKNPIFLCQKVPSPHKYQIKRIIIQNRKNANNSILMNMFRKARDTFNAVELHAVEVKRSNGEDKTHRMEESVP